MEWYNLSARYLWGPGVDMLLAEDQVSGTYFGSSDDTQDYQYWKVTDQENSVRVVLNRSGGTVFASPISLDSFGNDLSGAGDFENFLYTGRFHDWETGLQYNDHRWYNPSIGRWMSQDPIGFNGGQTNLYVYCGNSPTNGIDPTGEDVYIQTTDAAQGLHHRITVDTHDPSGKINGSYSISFGCTRPTLAGWCLSRMDPAS